MPDGTARRVSRAPASKTAPSGAFEVRPHGDGGSLERPARGRFGDLARPQKSTSNLKIFVATRERPEYSLIRQ